jgi:hypothetical protein
MRRFLIGAGVFLVLAGAGAYLFREPLKEAVFARLTADMFVAADDDAFDPGVAVGVGLPPLRAVVDGREIASIAEFAGARGTVLIANRSVDW